MPALNFDLDAAPDVDLSDTVVAGGAGGGAAAGDGEQFDGTIPAEPPEDHSLSSASLYVSRADLVMPPGVDDPPDWMIESVDSMLDRGIRLDASDNFLSELDGKQTPHTFALQIFTKAPSVYHGSTFSFKVEAFKIISLQSRRQRVQQQVLALRDSYMEDFINETKRMAFVLPQGGIPLPQLLREYLSANDTIEAGATLQSIKRNYRDWIKVVRGAETEVARRRRGRGPRIEESYLSATYSVKLRQDSRSVDLVLVMFRIFLRQAHGDPCICSAIFSLSMRNDDNFLRILQRKPCLDVAYHLARNLPKALVLIVIGYLPSGLPGLKEFKEVDWQTLNFSQIGLREN